MKSARLALVLAWGLSGCAGNLPSPQASPASPVATAAGSPANPVGDAPSPTPPGTSPATGSGTPGVPGPPGVPGVVYVKADARGANNGANWSDGFTSLQDALKAAQVKNQIWVAAGTYHPAKAHGDHRASFQLRSEIDIYGGFAGTETKLDQRDPVAHPVILSGDLNGDDKETDKIKADDPTRSDNSFRVVTGADNTTLDGVTIRDGHNNTGLVSPESCGAGMLNIGVSPKLNQVIFRNNFTFLAGGGMSNQKLAAPTLTNVSFIQNTAAVNGGGMDNGESSPVLDHVSFLRNASPIGGGMNNSFNSSPQLTHVIFSNNTAGSSGAALKNSVRSSPILNNVVFNANLAGNDGGGISNGNNSSPVLNNVVFIGNTASQGGAISNFNGSSPSLNQVTFYNNSANKNIFTGLVGPGGGLYDTSLSSPSLKNCLFLKSPIFHDSGTLVISYSSLEDDVSGIKGGGLITNQGFNDGLNPHFVNAENPAGPDGLFFTADDGLRLQADSPGRNTGSNAGIPALDMLDSQRLQEDKTDRGAYEFVP